MLRHSTVAGIVAGTVARTREHQPKEGSVVAARTITRRALRTRRQTETFQTAATPEAKLDAAFDVLRSRLKTLSKVDPDAAGRERVRLSDALMGAADQALATIEGDQ